MKKKKRKISITIVETVTVLLLIIEVIIFRNNLAFVNIFINPVDIYNLRSENSEMSLPGLFRYFPQWLTNGFLPFLLVIYLQQKNRLKVALVFVAYLILFMITMMKITFLLPFVMIGLYYIFRHNQLGIRNYFYSGFVVALTVMSLWLVTKHNDSDIYYTLAGIFLLRTVCVSGWLTEAYVPFFAMPVHPYTYFTHVNIINAITAGAYPYADSVGRTVAYGNMNANAIFLLMDGVCGWGPIGIVIVSVLFILVKGTLNSINLRYDKNLCIVIFLPAIAALLNVSLFTAVLSCGLLILYLLFLFTDFNELQITQDNIKH